MSGLAQRLADLAVVVGPKLLVALLILAAFALGSALVGRVVARISRRMAPGKAEVMQFLGQAARIAILVWGAVTALGTAGVNVSALVAGLGLTGFALGFAFKDVLGNLLAGILVLVYRPFRHGSTIAVAGYEGDVVAIDFRYTTLRGEGKTFLVPNSLLLTHAITVLESKGAAAAQDRSEAAGEPDSQPSNREPATAAAASGGSEPEFF